MLRTGVLALVALGGGGCSLILDFGGSTEAPIDAPYTQAECDYKEPNDTRETATPLEVADVGPAAICSATMGVDDRDFYKIAIPTNTMVAFRISYVFTPTGDLDIQLTDAQGSMVSASRSFDNDEVITCPGSDPPCVGPLAAGDYYLEVFPGQPGMGNRYDIGITITP